MQKSQQLAGDEAQSAGDQPIDKPVNLIVKQPAVVESPKNYTIDEILRHIPASASSASSTVRSLQAVADSGSSLDFLHQIWIHNQKVRAYSMNYFNVGQQNAATEPTTARQAIFGSAVPTINLRRYLTGLPQRHSRGPRRQRTTFTHEQTLRLEMEYHCNEYITRGKRFQLAEMLGLTENQIKIWFQNRRAKDKRIEKAIVEQQYRFLSANSYPASNQMSMANCSTCNYTKQQFATANDSESSTPT